MADFVWLGGEQIINTRTAGDQRVSDSTVTGLGYFAVVWRSDDPDASGIRLQLYSASGTPIGSETGVTSGRFDPKVTALNDGRFIVTWLETDTADPGLKGQLFAADGSRTGAAFEIMETAREYDISWSADGGFAVTWLEYAPSPFRLNNDVVLLRRFSGIGVPAGAAMEVSASGSDDYDNPEIATLPDGRFAIVWATSSRYERTFYDIEGRLADASGVPLGQEFVVGAATTGRRSNPTIAALTSGGFVVRFDNFEPDPVTGQARLTMGLQVYTAAGQPAGAQILREIGTWTRQPYAEEAIAALPGGGFATVWQNGEVYLETFDAAGGSVQGPVVVNTATAGLQVDPAIAVRFDGTILVTWTDPSATGGDASGTAIRGQFFVPPPPPPPQTLVGTEGDDTLVGGAGADTIEGRGGNDNLQGEGGADTIRGGEGNDYLNGGGGRNLLYGDGGDDAIDGGSDTDEAYGGSGADILLGNGGPDILHGDDGNDRVIGGDGPDQLFGGAGNDALGGGDGDDRLDGGTGADYMDGGVGNDQYVVDDPGDAVVEGIGFGLDTVRVSLSQYNAPRNVEEVIFTGTGGFEFASERTGLRLDASAATQAVIAQSFDGIDVLIGGSGNDNLSAGDGADQLFGGAGDDYLNTGNGLSNLAVGGAGNDAIEGGSGDDSLLGEDGDDILLGAGGNDRLEGGDGNDRVIGGAGADVLLGGAGNDAMGGGDGNDLLDGGTGADYMDGGAGDDQYILDDPDDAVVEAPGGGTDIVATRLSAYVLRPNFENLSFSGTAYKSAVGNALANDIRLNDAAGGSVQAGGGDDNVFGSAAADNIAGEGGDDRLYGFDGDDYLNGGAGNNILDGGAGNDALDGGDDAETLMGGTGDDTLLGNGGADRLEGGIGDDLLVGGTGDDILLGGAGADRIAGGDGADTIIGGEGADYMEGNGGADIFQFEDDALGAADTIIGFARSQGDLIDLVRIDADTNVAGDQGFSWIGAGAFTGTAGQLRVEDGGGGTYVVSGDVNGDGLADFSLILRGTEAAPIPTDFVF